MLDVGLCDVDTVARPEAPPRGELGSFRKGADLREAVIAADRLGLLTHELHAVVVGRVMARGDHDAAVVAAVEGREIHPFRAAHPDVDDIHAAVVQAAAY